MSIQVPTPKDLNKVKTKMAFGLTKRQLICFALAGCVGFPLYFILRRVFPTDVATMIMMLSIFPFFFFAMSQQDGKNAEQIIYEIYHQRIWSKGIRRYKSENIYHQLEEKDKIRREVEQLEAKEKRRGKSRKEKGSKSQIKQQYANQTEK